MCACQLEKECPKTNEPVCGSNRQDFKNKCLLRVNACKTGKPIYVKKSGSCSKSTASEERERGGRERAERWQREGDRERGSEREKGIEGEKERRREGEERRS